jgi:hypothetical protein
MGTHRRAEREIGVDMLLCGAEEECEGGQEGKKGEGLRFKRVEHRRTRARARRGEELHTHTHNAHGVSNNRRERTIRRTLI